LGAAFFTAVFLAATFFVATFLGFALALALVEDADFFFAPDLVPELEGFFAVFFATFFLAAVVFFDLGFAIYCWIDRILYLQKSSEI
ncbi:MAG: hypothetical protein ACPGVU_15360, partial [Limisphaerales bacterium]